MGANRPDLICDIEDEVEIAQEAIDYDYSNWFWDLVDQILDFCLQIFLPFRRAEAALPIRTRRDLYIGPLVPNMRFALNVTHALMHYKSNPEVINL